MPIYIERPQPNTIIEKDISDLEKIYSDYPSSDPHKRLSTWHQNLLDSEWQLVVARFNDRLLGALWLHSNDQQDSIHDICVRDITRGRGVGRRLIDHVAKASKTNQCELKLGHATASTEVQQVLEHLLANPSPFDATY